MTASSRTTSPRASATARVVAEGRGTQGELPIFDTPEDALKAAVMALGGYKIVGPMIWPTKSIEASAGCLRDCLNPDRAEKLDFGQTLFILRAARDRGCYSPFQWAAAFCGFDANPVTFEEEVDRATVAVESASRLLHAGLATLERLEQLQRGRS